MTDYSSYARACRECGHLPEFHRVGRCTLDTFCDGYVPPPVGRFHFSRFTVSPLTWILDRIGKCSTADDIDQWASTRGWWSRG